MELLKGIAASGGYAIGEAFVLDVEEFRIPRKFIAPHEVKSEIKRVEKAFEEAGHDYDEQIASLSKRLGEGVTRIIKGHLSMVSDPVMQDEVRKMIESDRFSPEYSVSRVIHRKLKAMENWGDSGFAQRIEQDLIEVERAILRRLLGQRREGLAQLTGSVIIVAHDLTPAQTATLDKKRILGLVTDKGGRTSHTSIVASSLGIPAVVGTGGITKDVTSGDTLIVDGYSGTVLINPDPDTIKRYQAKQKNTLQLDQELAERYRDAPPETKDGVKISILANLEYPSDLPTALEYGAEGVGLYRTEYLYLQNQFEPTEKEHEAAYREAVKTLGDRWLTIRTLDLGADKMPVDGMPAQANPFLGVRAVRLCLERVDLLHIQLRSILRVADNGRVGIMIPMISTVEEVHQVRQVLDEVKRQMREQGEPVPEGVPLGVMIEVPSAALSCELIAPHVDFISIGTNDLVAYMMAVDRTNENVASLYQTAHPAVLRVLKEVIDCGRRHEKPVSICGEMSGIPNYVPLLLGMGLRVFSVVPHAVPEVKRVLAAFTVPEAEAIASKAMKMESAQEIESYLEDEVRQRIPEIQ